VSALRQMLAALWVSFWVRWQLLAVRARRRFGGAAPGAAGSGFYLSASEIPVEGVDYDLAELPPELVAGLAASRRELVDRAGTGAARSQRRPRARRRRTVAVAVASLLALGVAGAGASALVNGTTGVPAVDRLLGIYEQNRPGGGLQPDPAAGSVSVEMSTRDGQRFVSTSYVAEDGRVCTAVTSVEVGGRGGVTCVLPSVVGDSLERAGGLVVGAVGNFDEALLTGFVRADVVEIEGSGRNGHVRAKLGPAWSPKLGELDSLKPFLAVADRQSDRAVTGRDYEIYAVTETGDRFQIAP
jgi:hypothetical protein